MSTQNKRTRSALSTPDISSVEEAGDNIFQSQSSARKKGKRNKKKRRTSTENGPPSTPSASSAEASPLPSPIPTSSSTDAEQETITMNSVESQSDLANYYDYVEEHKKDQLRKEGDIVHGPDGQRYKITFLQGSNKRVPVDRPVRIYADGIYDLFHFGHARSLMQAKKLFPNTHLLCGVCGDKLTHKMKGKTVMTEDERVESVSHCRYVDEVIPHAPWVATIEFCVRHNIDFMCHGQDLTVDENGVDTYQVVKDAGKFLYVDRTEGISTSDIILRLIRDYDDYVRRNLSRGYTYRDLNVSLLKEGQIKLQDQYHKVKNTVKEKKDVLTMDMHRWQKNSERWMEEFTRKFVGQVEGLVRRKKDSSSSSSTTTPDSPACSSSSANDTFSDTQ